MLKHWNALSKIGQDMLRTKLRQSLIDIRNIEQARGGAIAFDSGYPDSSMIPSELLCSIIDRLVETRGSSIFQYAPVEDSPELKKALRETEEFRGPIGPSDEIAITNGSQSAIFLVTRLLIDAGNTIVTEAPTYTAALTAFESFSDNVVGIDIDENGMDMDCLESLVKRSQARPKIIYVIPTFHNPTGNTMPLNRRKHLVELANRFNLIIIEDDAYGSLRFSGEKIPAVKHLDSEGRVVYLGSFSKILAPALRIGYVVADDSIVSMMNMSKVDAEQSTNMLSQQVIVDFIRQGYLQDHLLNIRNLYSRKLSAFQEKFAEVAPPEVKCSTPLGGMFLWINIHSGKIDTLEMLPRAIRNGVSYVPSVVCFPSSHIPNNKGMRINFTGPSMKDISEGLSRLCLVIKDSLHGL